MTLIPFWKKLFEFFSRQQKNKPATESVRNSETANSEFMVPACCKIGWQQVNASTALVKYWKSVIVWCYRERQRQCSFEGAFEEVFQIYTYGSFLLSLHSEEPSFSSPKNDILISNLSFICKVLWKHLLAGGSFWVLISKNVVVTHIWMETTKMSCCMGLVNTGEL